MAVKFFRSLLYFQTATIVQCGFRIKLSFTLLPSVYTPCFKACTIYCGSNFVRFSEELIRKVNFDPLVREFILALAYR